SHERPQLGGPDRVERDARRLEELVHLPGFLLSTRTRSPSPMPRTELYGPVMTSSPAFRPSSTSKYLSPATPILIGRNSAWLLRRTNTPSVSLRVWPGFSSCAAAPVSTDDAADGRRRLSSFGCRTIWPLAS